MHFRSSVVPRTPNPVTPAGLDIALVNSIHEVLARLDEIRSLTASYQHAHAIVHYSDLLLSRATQERARAAQQIASFLSLVNQNREALLQQLKATSQQSQNCLVLSKVYHQDFMSLLQSLALDLTDSHECLIAPLTLE